MEDIEDEVEVSLVIPAYNEEDVIEDAVTVSLQTLEEITSSYEVIISDNGSTDEMPEIANRLAKTHRRVRYVLEPQSGRGIAVETGFEAATGDILAFIDADLATDMQHLEELIESVRSEGYDLATGSRWISGHEAERPVQRTITSKGFNFLARTLLGSSLQDHQCGFKAFSNEVVETILPKVQSNHWFWDTETLVLATHHNYSIKEFPVKWLPQDESQVTLHKDVPQMFVQLLSLAIRLQTGDDPDKRTTNPSSE